MDAFYASVEQRDFPQYRGRPLAVGGSPERRGVICAASYEARQFGIHSAMPSSMALQRLSSLILVPPRFDIYGQVSKQIHEIFHEYTDIVEPLALDEAYLDVSTNKKSMPSATLIAREIKKRIREETELTASAGISVNKFLAKVASGKNKPDGLTLIPPEQVETFIASLPIEDFYGVGPKTAERMRTLGIKNGTDLKQWSEVDLINRFGKMGSYYYSIARGQDNRPVESNRIRKSIGAEESYAPDLQDRASMIEALKEIADTVKRRIDSAQTGGRTITLKVKYSDYTQITRSRTVNESVSEAEKILEVAISLFNTAEADKQAVRLLGISLSNLDIEQDDTAVDARQLTINFS